MDIYEYVKLNTEDFKTRKFNVVDAAILSRLVYLNLEGVVGDFSKDKDIELIDTYVYSVVDKIYEGMYQKDSVEKLYNAAILSPRYRNMKIKYFADKKNAKTGKQFAAMTFIFGDEACITYRGTDASMIGWKENLEMTYTYPIPSQKEAEDYLKKALKKLKKNGIKKIYVSGHSKGGNIGISAVLNAKDSELKCIDKIYAFDSPGFPDEIYNSERYMEIKDKIVKVIPKDSMIGILLDNRREYLVTDSKASVFFQHDICNWTLTKNDFKYLKSPSKSSITIKDNLEKWLKSSTKKEKDIFVESMYFMIKDQGESEKVGVLDKMKTVPKIYENYKKLPEHQRDNFVKLIKELVEYFLKK